MALPRKPERSAPIPNSPFESPKVSTMRGPYWDMPLGSGLEADPYGSVQTSGSTPSEPSAYLYGSNGFVGVGTGLQIGPDGSIEQGGGYIYCNPAYPSLPPSDPPYGCETEVNTAGVTDFTDAWKNCNDIEEFPCVDSSAVIDFSNAWDGCSNLTTFPNLNTSSGQTFTYAFSYTGVTSFPKLNLSSGIDFQGAWAGCYYMESFPSDIDLSNGENFQNAWCYSFEDGLKSFPALDLSSGTNFDFAWGDCTGMVTFGKVTVSSGTNFNAAWYSCTSLTSFPAGVFNNCSATNFNNAWQNCALNQTSVNNILVSINTAGKSNGTLGLNGGINSAPSGAGLTAKAALQSRGWTVLTN